MVRTIAVIAMLAGQLAAVERKEEKKEVKREKRVRYSRRSVPRPVIVYAPAPTTWKGAIIGGIVSGLLERAASDIARDEVNSGFGAGRTVSHQEATPEPGTMGSVSISSVPSGATIKIFGTVVGQTPLRTRLAPGKYTAVASFPGYVSSETVIELAPTATAGFEVTLVPVEPIAQQERAPDSGVVTLK